ncbi:hypothetical protein APED_31070 [Acanthopleuribacter pedis]
MDQVDLRGDAEEAAAGIIEQVRLGDFTPAEGLRKILALAEKHELDLADDLDLQGTGVMNTQDLPPIDKESFLANLEAETAAPPATQNHDLDVSLDQPNQAGPMEEAASLLDNDPLAGAGLLAGQPLPLRADAVLGQLNWYLRDILFLQFRRIDLFHREGETYAWDTLAEQVGLSGHRRELFDAVIGFLVKHEMLSVSEGSEGKPLSVRARTDSESVRKRLANLNLYHRKLLNDYPETAPLFRVMRACIEGFGDMLQKPSDHARDEPVSPREATLRMFALREVGE